MSKIYDCFNFFNELDVLETRLNILYDVVDFFIIVESSVTHSGDPKPYYFEENKSRFSKFLDKIISFKVEDTPERFDIEFPKTDETELQILREYMKISPRFDKVTPPDYGRDFYQKESVRRALTICDDEDIIMISDADEIPNPELIKLNHKMKLDDTIYSLNQTTYYYYINFLKQRDWFGTKIGKYKNMKKFSFNEIRGDESLSQKILDGGWHFSFMGGSDMVRKKITSYSARDMVDSNVLSNLEYNIENIIDPFFRSKLIRVEVDSSYPKYILDNIEKYKHMIK